MTSQELDCGCVNGKARWNQYAVEIGKMECREQDLDGAPRRRKGEAFAADGGLV